MYCGFQDSWNEIKLEAVSQQLFEHNIEINQALILSGRIRIRSSPKLFWIPLFSLEAAAVLCASYWSWPLCQKSHNRKMAFVALPSALFNISEIVIFVFP